MPLIEVEASEETSLVLSTVKELLDQNWSSKKLRRFENGEADLLDQVDNDLKNIGIPQFVRDGGSRDVAQLSELLGRKLLPGLTVSTLAAIRGIIDFESTVSGLSSKRDPRISFSFLDIVPDPEHSELILIRDRIYRKEDVALTPLSSLDGTMLFFRAKPSTPGQRINLNESEVLSMIIAQIVGSGEECVTIASNYAKYRQAFGKPIGSFQAVKHKLVDCAISVELCRSLCLGMEGGTGVTSSTMKYVSKKISRVISDTIQVHGGVGFTRDVDLHIHLRRVISLSKLFSND